MKTAQLLNYARDSWFAGEGQLAELPSAIDGSPVATTGSGGLDFGAMLAPRPQRRRAGLAQADVPRAGADHQRARPRHHGPQGRAVRAQLRDRRDAQGRLDRHRRRRRHPLLLLVQGPPRAARRLMSCSTVRSRRCRRTAPSWASTSTPRCRARRCTSTPSISRCGGCSRSSPRPCSRACRRSSSRPARPPICAKRRSG